MLFLMEASNKGQRVFQKGYGMADIDLHIKNGIEVIYKLASVSRKRIQSADDCCANALLSHRKHCPALIATFCC